MSHIKAIQEFVKSGDEIALIFEDDVSLKFKKYWKTDLETCIKNHGFVKKLHYDYITNNNKIATETYSVNENELKDLKIIIKEIQGGLSNNYKDMNKQIELQETECKNNEIKLKMMELIYNNKNATLNDFEYNLVNDIKNEIITGLVGEENSKVLITPFRISDAEKASLSSLKTPLTPFRISDAENVSPSSLKTPLEIGVSNENWCKTRVSNENWRNNNKIKPRSITSDRIPEIYQYDPSDLTNFIKKYNSPIDLARENSNIVLNSLRNAIKNNSIYKDYRWIYVKRNESPPLIIPLTKETIIKSHDKATYIARLDDKKNKIITVYTSHKEAIDDMETIMKKTTKTHSFNRAIKTGGLQFGFCWNYFDNCSMELQNDFLTHSKLPEKYVNPMSKSILKICPNTRTTIEIFNSKVDAAKNNGISTKTLNKILNTDEICQGFIWKYII